MINALMVRSTFIEWNRKIMLVFVQLGELWGTWWKLNLLEQDSPSELT